MSRKSELERKKERNQGTSNQDKYQAGASPRAQLCNKSYGNKRPYMRVCIVYAMSRKSDE